MAQKAVKKITISCGGTTYKVIEASPNIGKSVDDIDVTDFDDEEKVDVPHPQPKPTGMKVVLADDGTATQPPVGMVADYTFTTTYTDGKTASTPVAKVISGYFGKADPGSIQVAGERRPTWDCEFRKSGTVTTTTTAG